MKINIGNNFIVNEGLWPEIRDITVSKSLAMQYSYDNSNLQKTPFYVIFSIDNPIVYQTTIWNGAVPSGSGITQIDNDAYKTDFLVNWISSSQRPVSPWSSPTTGSFATPGTRATSILVGGRDGSNNLFPFASHYNGTIVNEPHGLAVSRGRFLNEFNFNQPAYAGTSGTTRTIVNGSIYTEPTDAVQRSVTSTNANDTAAGTGARTVRIRYFKGDGTGPFVENITLNGTIAVNTVATDIRFLESMEVLTVGSNGTNVGNIRLHNSTGGAGGWMGSINAGENRTYMGHHYIGTNKKGYLNKIIVGGTGTGYTLTVLKKNPFVSGSAEVQIMGAIRVPNNDTKVIDLSQHPLTFDGFTRITCYVNGDRATKGTVWLDMHFGDIELT